MSRKKLKHITQMLNQWMSGDVSMENELLNEMYPLLRKVAHKQLSNFQDLNFNTTIMVNEAYLKIKKGRNLQVNDKNHFLAFSARLIRHIIIDELRSNQAIKRGSLVHHVTLNDEDLSIEQKEVNIDWLVLNDLLNDLEKVDPESSKLIELRFFVGLNINEIADVLKTSTATVSRKWLFARSWLSNKLGKQN